MSVHDRRSGYILISANIEAEFDRLKEELSPSRVIGFIEDEFKIEHAKAVAAESYIGESEVKYLILGANSFNNVSQNSLLKLLEEPPNNVEYIIVSPTKSNLLPTVRSRMPIIKSQFSSSPQKSDISLNLSKPDYAEIFSFLKECARLSKSEAKSMVESIFRKATEAEGMILSQKRLQDFDRAYRLLELNARPQSVLAMIIMGLSGEKNAN